MNKPAPQVDKKQDFSSKIASKAVNKLDSRANGNGPMWFGLGMMGIIGWAVAIPIILGIAIGVWLDSRYGASYSWTLTLMGGGLLMGCLNAWHWVKKEEKEMRKGKQDD